MLRTAIALCSLVLCSCSLRLPVDPLPDSTLPPQSREQDTETVWLHSDGFHTGLVFFSILLSPLSLVTGIATHWLSRRNEYQADRFAVSTAPHPEALITALVNLTIQNMGNLHPHRLYVALYFSHPPVLQRIAAMEAVVGSSTGVDKKRLD